MDHEKNKYLRWINRSSPTKQQSMKANKWNIFQKGECASWNKPPSRSTGTSATSNSSFAWSWQWKEEIPSQEWTSGQWIQYAGLLSSTNPWILASPTCTFSLCRLSNNHPKGCFCFPGAHLHMSLNTIRTVFQMSPTQKIFDLTGSCVRQLCEYRVEYALSHCVDNLCSCLLQHHGQANTFLMWPLMSLQNWVLQYWWTSL